jgi:protein gp37
MSAISKIQWTDRTWNPTRGCSIVSPGCVNCYAMKQAHRFSGPGKAYEGLTTLTERSGPQWTGKVATVEAALLEPLSWRKPAKVFVNSMSDLFHEDVPHQFIDRVFATMAKAPQHTFQILTKRADRMRAYMEPTNTPDRIANVCGFNFADGVLGRRLIGQDGKGLRVERLWPLPNVWIGVSVENQHFADERIPLLLQTPAVVRFISAEPLLGPVDIYQYLGGGRNPIGPAYGGAVLDWVIVGGESGPRARPFDLAWARQLAQQCTTADAACFVKQLGAHPQVTCSGCGHDIGRGVMGGFVDACGPSHAQLIGEMQRIRDSKGGEFSEWPEDLRVREVPA